MEDSLTLDFPVLVDLHTVPFKSSPFFAEITQSIWARKLVEAFDGHTSTVNELLFMCQKALIILEDVEDERNLRSVLVHEIVRGKSVIARFLDSPSYTYGIHRCIGSPAFLCKFRGQA
jgi:hypothetical protein